MGGDKYSSIRSRHQRIARQFFVSSAWLRVSTSRRNAPSYFKQDYEETGEAIGISAWCLGLDGRGISIQKLSPILESIKVALNLPFDPQPIDNSTYSMFVASDCGMHDSGCFVNELDGPQCIMDLLDPQRIRVDAFAHASSYCDFLYDCDDICDPTFMICSVFFSYGRFLGLATHPLSRPKLWWRRFSKVTMRVRTNHRGPDSYDAVTGESEPGHRRLNPGLFEECTDLLVVVVHSPNDPKFRGRSWNPDAKRWQWCNQDITWEVVQEIVVGGLRRIRSMPPPELRRFHAL